MKKNVLPIITLLVLFASCSSAYRSTQTPDDVYYSPGKTQEYASAKYNDRRNSRYNEDEYIDPTSNEDRYLRMKVQNRAQWGMLDDYRYWNSPSYAYNNFYGFNSFNPYTLNSWGLSYYYSPFASIQPYSWFNNYYPSYGFGYGFSPNYGGYYGHNYSNGYYGYTPTGIAVGVTNSNRTRTSRPLLGGYTNNTYNNGNRRSAIGDRYIPANNSNSRYNNSNNSLRYENSNSNTNRFNNNTNNNTFTPSRSYSPSSSGSSSSSSGGSVSRPIRH